VGENIPEKEHKDADGECIEQLTERRFRGAQATQREAKHYGHAGDETEEESLHLAHGHEAPNYARLLQLIRRGRNPRRMPLFLLQV
jgi:hypothetical protein